jgi:nucleoside-diphosphate-sugar epimerase
MGSAHSGGSAVLVTGGAGYLGSVLVPKLLARHRVTVFDAMLFGESPLAGVRAHPDLTLVPGDLRDRAAVDRLLGDGRFDAIIHLAAISNDPSSELDPELTRSINLTATGELMATARARGVPRFINASSASVYGLKDDADVTEDLPLEPMTIYARCKAETEEILDGLVGPDFCGVSVRSATVCGVSPRLRLDLTINILTYHAIERRQIRVFGGAQMRPNIHIEDLTDFYCQLLEAPEERIRGRAFNVSTENRTVGELAEMVRAELDPSLPIVTVPTDDNRSYHLSARRAREELGFSPRRPLAQAVRDLADAFAAGRVPDAGAARYRNVEVMKDPASMRALAYPARGS